MEVIAKEGRRWQTFGGDIVDIHDRGDVVFAQIVKSSRLSYGYLIDARTLEALTGDRRDDLMRPVRYDAEQLEAIADLLRQILAVVSKGAPDEE